MAFKNLFPIIIAASFAFLYVSGLQATTANLENDDGNTVSELHLDKNQFKSIEYSHDLAFTASCGGGVCENGGFCTIGENNVKQCKCVPPYSGLHCERKPECVCGKYSYYCYLNHTNWKRICTCFTGYIAIEDIVGNQECYPDPIFHDVGIPEWELAIYSFVILIIIPILIISFSIVICKILKRMSKGTLQVENRTVAKGTLQVENRTA